MKKIWIKHLYNGQWYYERCTQDDWDLGITPAQLSSETYLVIAKPPDEYIDQLIEELTDEKIYIEERILELFEMKDENENLY